MTESPTDHLAPQLAAIDITMRTIDGAKAILAGHHAELAEAIVALAGSGTLTEADRVSVIHDLYWRHPEVKVKVIGPLVLGSRTVAEVAGPFDAGLRCEVCREPQLVTTRSELAHLRQWPPTCEECFLARVASEEAEAAIETHPSAWSNFGVVTSARHSDVVLVPLELRDARLLFALAAAGNDDTIEAQRARNTLDSASGGRADAPADLVAWAVDEASRLLDANELGVVGRVRASGLFERCTPSALRMWLKNMEDHLWSTAPASGW